MLTLFGLRSNGGSCCALIATAVLLVFAGAASPAAAASRTSAEFQEGLDRMGETFEANPELKTMKSSGWKPYNRFKWFHEQRMIDGELPPIGARWAAWETKRDIEAQGSGGLVPRSTWFSLGPDNLSGRMLSIAFHPTDTNTVYVGAAGGGLWRSTDDGLTWTPVSDELPSLAVGGVAVSPTDPNIVVIGTGEGTLNVDAIQGVGILRSTDGGDSWLTTSLTLSQVAGHAFHVVTAGPNGTFLAGATDGLWRSSDDGATWTQVKAGGDYYDVQWHATDPNKVFTAKGNATGNNVKVSTDDGVTWAKSGTGQPISFQIGKTKIALTADDPDRIYAYFGDAGTGGGILGLYRSTDGGSTWTDMNSSGLPGGQSWYNLACAADPSNANVVICGAVGAARSVNGGASFSSITMLSQQGNVGAQGHVDQHVLAYQPGTTNDVWIGNDGGIYESVNDGVSWTYRSTGLTTFQFYDICVNNGPAPYYVMGGTQDNGTDKWSGTTTWAHRLSADGMVCNINPVNGTTVFAEIQFGSHRKNTNSGEGGWSTIMNGISGPAPWVTPVDQDQNVGNHLYTSTNANIYRTTNGGGLWENVADHNATWISISPVDGNVVWTVAGTVRFTTDDGSTWNAAADFGFSVGGSKKVLAHPTDVNTAFVVFSGYAESIAHVARTTDMGASWENVTGNFPSHPVNAIAVNPSDPNQWFIGTDLGVWASVTEGVSWFPYGPATFPNTVVDDLEIQNALQKLVAGTHGRGAWEIDIAPTLGTDASEVGVAAGPSNLMLDRPSPNPIADRTLLRFAARHDGIVTLKIYDVHGRIVSDLGEFRGDGLIRTTPWFTDDVGSGVYFAVLRAGHDQTTQKLIVRK